MQRGSFSASIAVLVAAVPAVLAALFASTGHAASITAVTPRGEVAQAQQVRVTFDQAVVPLGSPDLPAPVAVSCQGNNPAGSGRWDNDRVWLFDFKEPLPPGMRCTVQARADWKPSAGGPGGSGSGGSGGAALTGPTEFRFSTGGPAVVQVQPWPGSSIEEDQHFLLQLSGPAVEADVVAKAGCEVEGQGDRLAVRVVQGAARDAVLKAQRAGKQAARMLLLACARPLPQDAKVRLVWGRGIGARINPQVVTAAERRFEFRVRPAFTAEFSCERERANAPCLPIRPLSLRFSAPVPRAQAQAVRLVRMEAGAGGAQAAVAPRFDPDDRAAEVSEVTFAPPMTENARFQIQLPADLRDTAGRPLANAASFPLAVATGEAPPIAKFASAPFGVVEWSPESALPVTLRHVQGDLRRDASGGQVRLRRLATDAEVLKGFNDVQRLHETWRRARELGRPERDWYEWQEGTDARGRKVKRRVDRMVATREVSLLAGDNQARRLTLPQLEGGDPRPFEVVGIPLTEPGYHVVEIESRRLGQALLDRAAPMYVRTGVLVTNLGLHFKQGRETSAVWVTSLDRGRPVAGADVAVNDCTGRRLWGGRTDASGLARIAEPLDARGAKCPGAEGLFVTARKADARGVTDMAFVFSDWNRGIEPWRFAAPVSTDPQPDARVHTVFDRTLLRAGETVSMKHFLRLQTGAGLAMQDPARLPTRLKIVHVGTGDEFSQPLGWAGARSATSVWQIPPGARLGSYRVMLERPAPTAAASGVQAPAGAPSPMPATLPERREWEAGEFRVEEFRVPLIDARLSGPKGPVVAPRELPLSVQLTYQSGGGVGQAPLRATALLRERSAGFKGFDDFSFEPPPVQPTERADGEDAEDGSRAAGRIVADKLALVTSREGAAQVLLKDLPAIDRPSEIVAEVGFTDPNGEAQTVSTLVRLWPAAVVPGIRARSWASSRGKARFTALALDTEGRPIKGQALEVRGRIQQVTSTRKRIVGGFYAWDSRTELKDLGPLCRGTSDDRGQLECEADIQTAGQVDLIVSAKDAAGRSAQASAGIWVTRQGELWFAQDNDDRIDLLPEKKRYEPGETARLQVRMPFRQATALVSVEREGVIDTRVVTLRGDDPTIEVPIDAAWAPNVYVSVLALRGRIREVPWYSLFTWGWREPIEWARSFWYEGREYRPPSAMIDLARPAFKLGVAALEVGTAAHELQVSVTPDKSQYAVREKARVRLRVTHAGKPVAGTEVAFAAVDEGLLALRPNESWGLLQAMLQPRAWGVTTSTAQGEIIGRRHYGRKAVAAGGGGGRGGTRELFDTLLMWSPRVVLDANGEAVLEVPLNDSLTSFRLVAVADAVSPAGASGASGPSGTSGGAAGRAPVQRFGTGSAVIRVSQDLQLLSGLPPLVREGDRFSALLTLRNTTAREMTVRATLRGTAHADPGLTRTPLELPPRELKLAAGAALETVWPVEVPAGSFSIGWEAQVEEVGAASPAHDRLKLTQIVVPAVPVRTLQATLQQLDGAVTLPVAPPADALALPAAGGALRGGLAVSLQPRLSGALPGLRRYFETYPFSCLEQQASRAIGLRDTTGWSALTNTLPTYLDEDGLAGYFPLRAEDGPRGSDRLTAYLIATAHEAGFAWPAAARDRMLDGLTSFVEGRLERRTWSPRPDLDVRKLAALEALSRHGRAQPRMLGSLQITPQQWPTAAVIDWLWLLRRVDTIPDRARRLDEAQQVLRARLAWSGTTLRFSTEGEDGWWWLMDSADTNAARLILAVMDEPGWRTELPRLVGGHLARQQRGAWSTTTANAWGALALERFGQRFESAAVGGRSTASTAPGTSAPGAPAPATQAVDWGRSPEGGRLLLPWPAQAGTLQVLHQGAGRPWLSVQSLAAVPLKAPVRAGYGVTRSVSAVQRKDPARWSRGDIVRVRLEVEAGADRTWVVVSDPVPGGATLLGSGLGRDSALATRGERREGSAWPAFEERGAQAFSSYFEFLPRGRHVVEYTLRLNNPGRFALPPTRVEAMYAPETFGEAPNEAWEVAP